MQGRIDQETWIGLGLVCFGFLVGRLDAGMGPELDIIFRCVIGGIEYGAMALGTALVFDSYNHNRNRRL